MQPKPLNIFKLIMMSVVAIDSLKNLPINAFYGTNLLIYYSIAVLTFFLPTALVVAELATSLPQTGGVYIWIKEAFGARMAFLMIWLQWMICIFWFPTILTFIALMLIFLVKHTFTVDPWHILFIILIIFWSTLFLVSRGIHLSSHISTWSAVIGVIIPMGGIIMLGSWWLYTGHTSHLSFATIDTPHLFNIDNFRLSMTLLYSLMGIEMIGAHAGDVKNPQRDYPFAIFWAACIILITIVPASLAIAIVIPRDEINISSSLIESFIIFLNAFHLNWLTPWILLTMILGSFGIFYNWLLSSCRCLLVAAEDGCLPLLWRKKNAQEMPVALLFFQGIIFTLLSSILILIPSINLIFLLLTIVCGELALIYYIGIFSAAFYLRFKQPHLARPFKIGNKKTLSGICLMAILTCLLGIICGFIPPDDNIPMSITTYELTLISLTLASIISGLWIFTRRPFLTHSATPKIILPSSHSQ